MNLSPEWADFLMANGWEAVHWTSCGDPKASDRDIMNNARDSDYVVLTHDLDFGTILALNHSKGPSVIQVRASDVLASDLKNTLLRVLIKYSQDLENGAILVIDSEKTRIRILPI
ncbi:MAG: DUF5615 family PIN-like protein [Candidatus Omnitrophica bacterium]|nr:DUF5615 family PIN-like protein [Candidatus Omnitrophota bacterium]